MRLQLNGRTFQISIPKALINAKGWSRGDKLKIVLNNKGDLIIVKENG